MPTIETMSLEEVDAAMAQLRARCKVLKSPSKVAQRKIITLARRREALIEKANALDEQIAQLREGQQEQSQSASDKRRTRRSQAQVTACLDAIVACVKRHAVTKRATIVDECHLSPANATTYLRRLCEEGKLIRRGEKSATTYTLA